MEKLIMILSHWAEPEILAQYSEYFLIIVFLYSFTEVVFPPIPGDTLLVISGSITAVANFNPIWVIIVASLGTFCGSVLLYNFGRKMEGKILSSSRFSWMLDSKTFLKIEHGFNRFGFLIILLSRFLPVARSGVFLAAGMVNLDRKRSFLAVSLSIIISTSVFVFGGRFLGRQLESMIEFWQAQYWPILLWALAGIIMILSIIYLIKLVKKPKYK